MKNNKIVYALTIEDIQTVAEQELDRNLTKEEIDKILAPIAEHISWYDAIAVAIRENIS